MAEPELERRHLSEHDIDRLAQALAPVLVKNVRASHHEFWIDPERHFRAHLSMEKFGAVFTDETIAALRELTTAYNSGRRIFWRIFIGLVALGSIGLALFAFSKKGGGL